MKAHADRFLVPTSGKRTYEVTGQIQRIVRDSAVKTGQATIFVRHTSASLIIMENADPSARTDLHGFFDRLVPENAPWFVHTCEGPDDMPSHIRMVLTGCSLTVPILDGDLALGTWQGIFLFEHRKAPHTREIAVSVIGQ
ncbi:MAG: secondary thiamine-phosphate synthase enzyme YjbQ [Verrucomicrobia bacterium]|nr:secondary thiamine-phosphate synthase enzyme YjbQ [Verrucomicrobiota bacterium]